MFEAGACSTAGTPWRQRAWPAAAAVLALALAGESWLLASGPAPRVVERLVVVREPSGTPSSSVHGPAVPADGCPRRYRGRRALCPIVRTTRRMRACPRAG